MSLFDGFRKRIKYKDSYAELMSCCNEEGAMRATLILAVEIYYSDITYIDKDSEVRNGKRGYFQDIQNLRTPLLV